MLTSARARTLSEANMVTLLATQPPGAVGAALRAFHQELQRCGLPLDDPTPLLQRAYEGLGPGWTVHLLNKTRGKGQVGSWYALMCVGTLVVTLLGGLSLWSTRAARAR
jgi:hypothetical protein